MTDYLSSANGKLALESSPYIYHAVESLSLVNSDGITQHVHDEVSEARQLKLTQNAQDALTQAQEIWLTEEGQKLKDEISGLPVVEAIKRFQSLIELYMRFLQPLSNLSNDPLFEQPSVSGAINTIQAGYGSVVLTAGLTVDVLGGVGIGVGYAYDPDDTNRNSIFIFGTALAGAEETVVLGESVGVCAASPDGIAGFAVGGTATEDLQIVGGAVSVMCGFNPRVAASPHITNIDLSNWSASIAVDEGESLGASVIFSATFVLMTNSTPPIAQTDAPYMFRIKDANCLNTMDDCGKDEVYVEFQIDGAGPVYRWPTWSHVSVPEGGTANFLRTVKVNHSLKVWLKQGSNHEILSATCSIGDGNFPSPGTNHTFECDYTSGVMNEVEYKLNIERIV